MTSPAFYKEENLKQTAIGKIPKDWEIVTIGDVAETTSGGTPSRMKKEYYGGNIPWVKSGELKDNTIHDTDETITDYGLQNSSAKLFRKGTLLVALYGATVGKTGILGLDSTTNQAICAIIPRENEFDSHYIKYQIIARRGELIAASSGGAQPNISQGIVRSFRVPLPILREQHEITEVLSKVDEVIQKTSDIVTLTERLKKGLMQDLLTNGIGHTEFKDTEIGRIPTDWKVVRLGDSEVTEIRGNKVIDNVDKVAFIPMDLVPNTRIFAQYEMRDVSRVSSSTYCEAGDLLLAKITPSLENGKQGIVPDDVPGGFCLATTEVYPIVCIGIERLFLFYILKFAGFRKVLESSMRGTTGRLRVPKKAIEKLEIPFPPVSEQREISHILSTLDKKLEVERNEKEKLEEAKRGLMDLLLTGKIRIKVE